MEYSDFIESVKADLPDRLTGMLEGAAIEETHVSKLQGRSYDGIRIMPYGSGMGLMVDMQPYFQSLKEGAPYEMVLGDLADKVSNSIKIGRMFQWLQLEIIP